MPIKPSIFRYDRLIDNAELTTVTGLPPRQSGHVFIAISSRDRVGDPLPWNVHVEIHDFNFATPELARDAIVAHLEGLIDEIKKPIVR